MSHKLINRSSDLQQLRDEGYDIEIHPSVHLLVRDVPYVDETKTIQRGIVVSKLELADDVTLAPTDHTVRFIGSHPCRSDGSKLVELVNSIAAEDLGQGLKINFSFSRKPTADGQQRAYKDYYEKVTTYVELLQGHARVIDPNATACTHPLIETSEEESVFLYLDTASSRAGIGAASEKLALGKIAIVGLGGTGSYVLDLVAKTPVKEIHLFDGDKFVQHNAFRSPSAASGDETRTSPLKVRYFAGLYSKMRRNIIAHESYLEPSNLDLLQGMDFVFLCLDRGADKRHIVEKLLELKIPFIDVGMGAELRPDNSLGGILRVTTVTPAKHDHLNNRIPFSDPAAKNEYATNIQIADLNALNAALAVIKWKKLFGFYSDLEHEHFSAYTIDGNHLLNEDKP
jgi:hypothetical protein